MSASTHATLEELEALARGELAPAQAVSIDAHLAECESCQRELSWIRAESGLLARRPRPSLPPDLWRNIEAQLPLVPPIHVPLPAARSGPLPRPRRSQVAQWFAVAAAAAAMLVVYSVGGAPMGRLRQSVASLFGAPTAPKVIISVENSDDELPPESTSVQVPGAVTLHLSTMSADIEAVAGERERVRLAVSEVGRKIQLELRSVGPGELRAIFNGQDRLESGHVKVELPPGSRLEVQSASGSLTTRAIGGDVRAQTASGDVQIREARKVEIDTASGDLSIDDFTGAARLHTASGDAHITRGSAPFTTFDWNSASGELALDGRCANDCRMNIATVSGDVALRTSADSSYTAQFHTMTGELEGPDSSTKKSHDDEDDEVIPARDRTVRIGGGVGVVKVTTVSGDLSIGAR
jgi:hypothetical protein